MSASSLVIKNAGRAVIKQKPTITVYVSGVGDDLSWSGGTDPKSCWGTPVKGDPTVPGGPTTYTWTYTCDLVAQSGTITLTPLNVTSRAFTQRKAQGTCDPFTAKAVVSVVLDPDGSGVKPTTTLSRPLGPTA